MRYRVERSMASGRSWGEGRREEGSILPVHMEQLHTYVYNDAVEAVVVSILIVDHHVSN